MSHLSYENRIAILVGVCAITAIVLLVAFFLIYKNTLSDAQLSIPTPDLDLNGEKRALDEFKAQNVQAQTVSEQGSALSEQEQTTPLQDITQEQ